MNGNTTKDWDLYEAGVKYHNSLAHDYYATIDANIAFYNDDQWRNVQANGLPTPVFNIIKRAGAFFVASLTSTKSTVKFDALSATTMDAPEQVPVIDVLNSEVENLMEKFKFENRTRDALFKAFQMGDVAAHFYWDATKKPYGGHFSNAEGEICMELINGPNVFFGNANNPDVQIQPYIILHGRDMIANLKAEAKKYHEDAQFDADTPNENGAGDAYEIEVDADDYGKADYILIYRKDADSGRILMSKCAKTAYIYKDIDTGLSRYPISWLRWEGQENQYHGKAMVTGLIPNQIYINRGFAMIMFYMLMSFPKLIYNGDMVDDFSNEIGEAIRINSLPPGTPLNSAATYIEAGDMPSQILNSIEIAIAQTKEAMGINDGTLGNVNPDQASGAAIVATAKQTTIPLENIRANMYEWIENCGLILLDMMSELYGIRPVVMTIDGQRQLLQFDFEMLKDMYINVSADVGASTYWSEVAQIQTMDKLLSGGHIDFQDYLERIPDAYIPRRQELLMKLRQALEQKNQQVGQIDTFVQQLPPEIQQKLAQLKQQDPNAYQNQVMKMMQQGGQQ